MGVFEARIEQIAALKQLFNLKLKGYIYIYIYSVRVAKPDSGSMPD